MISKPFVTTMARYNRWQNESLFGAADLLGEDQRRKDRGSFFGSIHKTFSHLVWGDMIWTSRFAGLNGPEVASIGESALMVEDWEALKQRRIDLDAQICEWADGLEDQAIEGELSWFSGAVQKDVTRPLGELLVHFFNHQTHHRGQIHAMITAAGGQPDDTDLFVMSMR